MNDLNARSSLTPRLAPVAVAALLAGSLALTGCAIGNKAELHLVRNVTFGQEMLDLQRAKEEGALTEEEYAELKSKLMEHADLEGVVQLVEHISPDDDD